jgi:hypothetical protein
MPTSDMVERFEAREPDWKGKHERRFRWSRFRWEWGRACYIVAAVEGDPDIVWWEWDDELMEPTDA